MDILYIEDQQKMAHVNKGSDMAAFGMQPERRNRNAVLHIDEIAQYQAGRYMGSNKTVWRIFLFSIHERSPAVVHLAVHLENGQRVYLTAANVQRIVLNPPATKLLSSHYVKITHLRKHFYIYKCPFPNITVQKLHMDCR
ncbi:unnamed protein product [Onchocerca ochengi]|uniref:DUF4258 domain-containing protein n=1 Tax=Onchocerca ochengi TaxID=42157 RepID=A0A182EXX3_ONCOC|nr:unnamed protein product [Onchocerca ochengi]